MNLYLSDSPFLLYLYYSMGIRELQDGKLYKMHEQKLDNTEKIERINEGELTRQLGFGTINMLGGFLAVFFAARNLVGHFR